MSNEEQSLKIQKLRGTADTSKSVAPTTISEKKRTSPQIASEKSGLSIGPQRKTTVISENNGDKNSKITSIDELDKAFLPPDQKEAIAKKLTDKDANDETGKMGRTNGDQNKMSLEDSKIFEEGDIIDWMFKNILVASMNWAGNKAANVLTYLVGNVSEAAVDYLDDASHAGAKKVKNAWAWLNPFNGGIRKYPETDTTRFRDSTLNINRQILNDSLKYDNPQAQAMFSNALDALRRGKADEFNRITHNKVSPETLQGFLDIPQEQRDVLLSQNNIKNMTKNMCLNLKAAQQFSANVATARMLQEKAEDPKKPSGDQNSVYAQYMNEAKEDFLATMQIAQTKGKNPLDVAGNLVELAYKAAKHSTKRIDKYQYAEVGNQPGKNKYLEKIDIIMEPTKNFSYKKHSQLDDFAQEVCQATNQIQRQMQPISASGMWLSARTTANTQRKERLQKIKNNIKGNKMQYNYDIQNIARNRATGGR